MEGSRLSRGLWTDLCVRTTPKTEPFCETLILAAPAKRSTVLSERWLARWRGVRRSAGNAIRELGIRDMGWNARKCPAGVVRRFTSKVIVNLIFRGWGGIDGSR